MSSNPSTPGQPRPLRVAVVTQYFAPESVPVPMSVPIELAERGHQVRVVTAYPNYPEGRLYPGFRQRFGHVERHGKLVVRRTPIWVSHSRNPVGRILNYISFGVSSLSATRFIRHADVIYVYATQMTAAVAPLVWWRLWKIPYVLHVQDLWPESVLGSGMISDTLGRVAAALMQPWLRTTYNRAAVTMAIAPTMASTLVERGVPADRVRVIFNWAPKEAMTFVHKPPAAPRTHIVYAGTIGPMQDVETLVDALRILRNPSNISVDVYGDGLALESVRERAARLGIDNISFHGRLPIGEVSARIANADFQLVTLKPLPVFRMTIPSKFQSSLAMGIPVITTVGGDLESIVREHGLGFAARPGDAESLARAIREAAATDNAQRIELRRRSSDFYSSHMSMASGISALEGVLRDVADARDRRTFSKRRQSEVRK